MTDEAEKRLVVERLYEKGERAALQRSCANRGCFPARHHDHFRVGRQGVQPRLHFQAARLWHPHIEQGQGYRIAAGMREKYLRSQPGMGGTSVRAEDMLCRIELR